MSTLILWQIIGYVIALATASLIFWLHSRMPSPRTKLVRSSSTAAERAICFTLIATGVLLRVIFLDEFQGGKLTSDENLTSIIYISGILHGEPTRFGADKIVHAFVLDAWIRQFGLSPLAIRSLSTTFGLVGLVFWYLSLHRLSNPRISLWATALLSVSVFGIYFGRLALELNWVLFFIPLAMWGYSLWIRAYGLLPAVFTGAAIAFGLFTYPGFLLALIAIEAGLAIAWRWCLITKACSAGLAVTDRSAVIGVIAAAVSLAAITSLIYYAHITVFSPSGGPLFYGGGNVDVSADAIIGAIYQMGKDLFYAGSSWYLPFPKMPFVETVLWPFCIYGIFWLWLNPAYWWARGLAFSMVFVILLCAMTGPYPGMRRAIYFLLPFYFFSAVGIARFVDITSAKLAYSAHRKLRSLSVIMPFVIALILIHPIFYQVTFGRDAVAWNFGEGFGARKIPMEYLLETLEDYDVILSRSEVAKYFDHLIYEHYPKLAKRYGLLPDGAHSVYFLEDNNNPRIQTLQSTDDWRFLTWRISNLYRLGEKFPVCIDLDVSHGDNVAPFSAFRKVEESPPDGTLCLPRGDGKELDSVFYMGYRHRAERITHKLSCGGPYCDETRSEFLYTLGGAVSFALSLPPEGCVNGCQLLFQLANPQADRKSRVLVGAQEVGMISIENIENGNAIRFPLPVSAIVDSNQLRVSIVEVPGNLGWDIRYAAIVPKGW